jgi:hypothetical protein
MASARKSISEDPATKREKMCGMTEEVHAKFLSPALSTRLFPITRPHWTVREDLRAARFPCPVTTTSVHSGSNTRRDGRDGRDGEPPRRAQRLDLGRRGSHGTWRSSSTPSPGAPWAGSGEEDRTGCMRTGDPDSAPNRDHRDHRVRPTAAAQRRPIATRLDPDQHATSDNTDSPAPSRNVLSAKSTFT